MNLFDGTRTVYFSNFGLPTDMNFCAASCAFSLYLFLLCEWGWFSEFYNGSSESIFLLQEIIRKKFAGRQRAAVLCGLN